MLGVLNKREFAELLYLAIGDRSINGFGRDCGVSGSYISRLTRGLVDKAPGPEVIKRFSDQSSNGVTYEQLMIAAGLLPSSGEEIVGKMLEQDAGRSKDLTTMTPPNLQTEFTKLGFDFVSFVHDNEVTVEELEELLSVLRTIKKRPLKKKTTKKAAR